MGVAANIIIQSGISDYPMTKDLESKLKLKLSADVNLLKYYKTKIRPLG